MRVPLAPEYTSPLFATPPPSPSAVFPETVLLVIVSVPLFATPPMPPPKK
jgi:hypothetical protein